MKNTRLLLAALLFLAIRTFSFSQSFEKGTSIVSLSTSLGVYNDKLTTHISPTSSSTGKTISGIYTFSYEYGLTNWLGAGIQVQYDKYIDSSGQKQTVYNVNVPLFINAHFVKSKHVDLSAGIGFAYSYFRINSNDVNATSLSGSGTLFDIHVIPRFYLGNHIGIFVPLSYGFLNYPNLDLTSSQSGSSHTNWADFHLNGMNIGIGLSVRF
jgi:hypothetical protein